MSAGEYEVIELGPEGFPVPRAALVRYGSHRYGGAPRWRLFSARSRAGWVAVGDEGFVRVLDQAHGALLRVLAFPRRLQRVMLAADGNTIVLNPVGKPWRVYAWAPARGAPRLIAEDDEQATW